MAQQKFSINIPTGYSDENKKRIGDAIIDFIKNRSKKGLDKNNNKFARYTKDYAEEKGVSPKDVDLTLSGEMLDSLSVLSVGRKSLDIGYQKGDLINDKVEGNITGSYGQPMGDSSKARDFLGIDDKDLNFIFNQYPKNDEEQATQRLEDTADTIIAGLGETDLNSLLGEVKERQRQARLLRLAREA